MSAKESNALPGQQFDYWQIPLLKSWFRVGKLQLWKMGFTDGIFPEQKNMRTDQIITIVIGNARSVVAKTRNNKSYVSFY